MIRCLHHVGYMNVYIFSFEICPTHKPWPDHLWPYKFPHSCLNCAKYNADFDDFSINTSYSLVKLFRTKRRDLSWIFSMIQASAMEHICQIIGVQLLHSVFTHEARRHARRPRRPSSIITQAA